MTLQAKWMLRRHLKQMPAHCKYSAKEPYLKDRLIFQTQWSRKILTTLKVLFLLLLVTYNFFSQSFSGFYGGRRELSISFHPSFPSDEDCEWRRAQYHSCRAASGLHDHSTTISLYFSYLSLFSPFLFLRIKVKAFLWQFLQAVFILC